MFFKDCRFTSEDVKKRTFLIEERLKRVVFAKGIVDREASLEYSIFGKLETSEYR
jgi:hypothetical protein